MLTTRVFSRCILLATVLTSCARSPEPIRSSTPVASAEVRADSDTSNASSPIGLVDATIMFSDCEVVSKTNAKLAQKTMRQLVEACNEVPGGTAQFTATLLVDGRIELSTADGGLGTVPVCVLRHELKHKLTVKKPCNMQVQMTERKAAVGVRREGP